MAEPELIRFVADPEGRVVPDLARRLPGRGVWVRADRAALETAVRRGLFARAAKAPWKASDGLADQVEALLARRCLDQLGLARREGVLISGFEKVAATLKGGRAAWLVEASDSAADGRSKLMAIARRTEPQTPVCGAFSGEDLSLALGLENAIHLALLAGRRAERWTEEVTRLGGFRSLLPPSWRED